MIKRNPTTYLIFFLTSAAFLLVSFSVVIAQTGEGPLTSQELVRLVYQLPKQPGKKEAVIEEVRRRGIGFPLTDGMRSLVASKAGNDPDLRRTLEEAERRRVNPRTSARPSEAESLQLLEKTRAATLAAAEAMPDFVVKQLVTRSISHYGTNNWLFLDRLTIAVGYREKLGEEYKLLAINGLPPNREAREGAAYSDQAGGATSAGEFASTLAETFDENRHGTFKMVDTDTLRGRSTVIYEYQIEREVSSYNIKISGISAIAGYHGRLWIDRESNRVLRFEIIVDIPPTIPARTLTNVVDYDWVTIAEQRYLLPSRAEVIIAYNLGSKTIANRNLIHFRGYQKYGTEVKIIEGDFDDLTEEKP